MREARRPYLAAIGFVRAIRYQIHAKFSLRRLNSAIDLAGRHMEAFRIKFEMVDQSLHRTLHLRTRRRYRLPVLSGNGSLAVRRGKPSNALLHNLDRLTHLLQA